MMRRPDDWTLMAYADGALDGTEHTAVEAVMRCDAAARNLVAMYLRTNIVARLAFEEPMLADMPPRLLGVLTDGQDNSDDGDVPNWQLVDVQSKSLVRKIRTFACLVASAVFTIGAERPVNAGSANACCELSIGHASPNVGTFVKVDVTAQVPLAKVFALPVTTSNASNFETEPESSLQ